MKIIFKAFAKQLFGAKYEKLTQTLFVYFIVFWGSYIADIKIVIAPSIFYLMISTFTAGVMWQALSSKNNDATVQNIIMLPFDNGKFVFSYIAALGIYTIFTKTAAIFAILLAVSVWSPTEILGSILCAIHAILITAAIYSFKKLWYTLWAAAVIIVILLSGQQPWFLPLLILHSTLVLILLQHIDAYAFFISNRKHNSTEKKYKQYSVWRYFFRYLAYHKNYLINTVFMWCVACILPLFFKQMERLFVIPIGFAILSLNTPISILLSCDPALEQAIRFLPGQKKIFCVPYCLFIFLCNIIAEILFLCSFQIQNGGITILIIVTAIFFALQSAICSVLLEWFFPVKNWNIESDLWHHPRKYVVPVTMLFLAGAVGALPKLVPAWMLLLIMEAFLLLFHCWER